MIPDTSKAFLDAYGVAFPDVFRIGSSETEMIRPIPAARETRLGARERRQAVCDRRVFPGNPGFPDTQVEIGVTYINPTIEALDPESGKWEAPIRMPTPRFGLAALPSNDGKIFIVGGRGARGAMAPKVETFDPENRGFKSLKAMPVPVYNHAAAYGSDGKIYVFGGRDRNDRPRKIIQSYDPESDSWEASNEPMKPEEGSSFDEVHEMFGVVAGDRSRQGRNEGMVGRALLRKAHRRASVRRNAGGSGENDFFGSSRSRAKARALRTISISSTTRSGRTSAGFSARSMRAGPARGWWTEVWRQG